MAFGSRFYVGSGVLFAVVASACTATFTYANQALGHVACAATEAFHYAVYAFSLAVERAFPTAAAHRERAAPLMEASAFRQGERPRHSSYVSRRVARTSDKRHGAPLSHTPAFASGGLALC